MTMTPEQLAVQLETELAPLPTTPRLTYPEILGRAASRRTRRRRTYAGAAVTLLAAAAAAVSLVVVDRPAHEAVVRPVTPAPSPTVFRPAALPALAGDVDGDGGAGVAAVDGTRLTVRGSRVGVLTLTLPSAGYTIAGAAVDIGDSGYADLVLEQDPGANGPTYSLVALAHPDAAHPALGLVTTPDRQSLELFSGGGDSDQWSWTCQSANGTLNRVGLLTTVDYRGQAGTLVRETYRLDGDLATPVSTTTTPSSAAAGARAQAVENRCSAAETAPLTATPTGAAPTSATPPGATVAGHAGIDGEQFGTGVVSDGTGRQVSYAGLALVRRTFQGGSVEVPTGWVETDATLPSDHSDYLFYDPANPTARFEVSESGCVECASKNGDGVTPDPGGPSATTSSVMLPGGRSVAFTEKPWLGYAVNGVDTVLTGAQNGGTGPVGGYALYRVALPTVDTALETTILDSVRLT